MEERSFINIIVITQMKVISKIAWILVIVGALNWGLVGIGTWFVGGANWNVVNLILGSISWLENLVYILVGLSGIVALWGCKSCKNCQASSSPMA